MKLLILVAIVIIPAVAKKCCLPDRFTVVRFRPGSGMEQYDRITADFPRRRFLVKTLFDFAVKEEMVDLNANLHFKWYKDGACSKEHVDGFQLQKQCMPAEDVSVDGGSGVTDSPTKNLVIKNYKLDGGHDLTMYLTDKCFPVRSIAKDHRYRQELKWGKPTLNIDESVFNVDTSSCHFED